MDSFFYTFLYRRRSGYFYLLSSLAGRLTPEMTRTSTIEKSIVFSTHKPPSYRSAIHKTIEDRTEARQVGEIIE
jgi:hypothetical protein